jgi:invasion protein IalB
MKESDSMARATMTHGFVATALFAACVSWPPVQAFQGGAGTLPADARSVQEIYDDWTVTCVQKDNKKLCSLSQQQLDKDSRQRVLALELTAVTPDKADGTLLLPFGLAVAQKVTLNLDGSQFGTPFPFRTCLVAGCLVNLSFDTRGIADLKKGMSLAVKATSDGGLPIIFTLSLKGFGSAFDRTVVLAK